MKNKSCILLIRENKSKIKTLQTMEKLAEPLKVKGVSNYFFMTSCWLKSKSKQYDKELNRFSEFLQNNPDYKTIVCEEPQKLTRSKDKFLFLVTFFKQRKMQVYFTKSDMLLFNNKFEINPVLIQNI